MTTFFAFRTYGQNVTAYRLHVNGIEFMDMINANTAEEAVLTVCQKYDDSNYFPNEDETEVADCDGNVIWETGDKSIDMGDYTYSVYTREELNEDYNEKELNAVPETYFDEKE